MPDQPGGIVWARSAYHQKEKVGIVVLEIPGRPPYYMRADEARKVGADIIAAAAVARLDAGVFIVAEEDGLPQDQAQAYLERVGRAGGGIDPP